MGGPRRVAILGDGPAATSLATWLAGAGLQVAFFSRGRPRGLIVGESLVPGAIPLLRELGVEEEVRRDAQWKPGASFVVRDGDLLEIDFAEACTRVPGYAYNVLRDRFDATLQARAERAGAIRIPRSAGLQPGSATAELDADSAAAARVALGGAPEFLVDATGRSRLFARHLGLPTRTGPRRDDALFAHWHGIPIDRPGHVHSDRLERGWCWRIPLPGVVSMGVVVPRSVARGLGATAEAQLEALVRTDPYLSKLCAGATRTSAVSRYDNYQLVGERAVGDGWALVGDAFGFVDPVFSSGLYLALEGARELARALTRGSPRALARYERRHRRHLEIWQGAVETFYDGRFFALLRLRGQRPAGGLRRRLHDHVSKHVPRVFTGEASSGGYSARLLQGIAARGLPRDQEPSIL